MSAYLPPTSIVPIYNPSLWPNATEDGLTTEIADTRYVSLSASQSVAGTKTFDNQFLISSGTVGAPAIGFSAEPTLGIYRNGSSSLDVAVGGVRALGVTSSTFLLNTIRMSTTGTISFVPSATTGGAINSAGQTLNDPTSSGIVAHHNSHYLGRKTLSANTATTYTNSYGVFFAGPPAPGSSVTLPTRHTIGLDWGSIINLGTTSASGATNQIIWPLGTVALPSYTFLNDQNTGIYSPGADQVAVSAGGVNVFSASSAGVQVNGASSTLTIANTAEANAPNTGALQCQGGAYFGGLVYIRQKNTGANPGLFIESHLSVPANTYGTLLYTRNTSFTTGMFFPPYAGDDTLVSELFAQTVSNKTLTATKFGDNGTNFNDVRQNVATIATGIVAGGNGTATLTFSPVFASTPRITGSIKIDGGPTNGTIVNACILTFGNVSTSGATATVYNTFTGPTTSACTVSWMAWI
jgi:hypothetical protein